MVFVVDKGLDVLLAQIDEIAPNRSKASDGSIGDAAHAARVSDHNPEHPPPPDNPDYEVDARDFTHDPAHGADMAAISEAIRVSRDRRVSYVIFNRRIFSDHVVNGYPAYTWRPYSGTDPHTGHMHVSANDVHNDETQPWEIGAEMLTTEQIQEIAREAAKEVWIDFNAGSSQHPDTPLHILKQAVIEAAKDAQPEPIDYDQLAAALLRKVLPVAAS